ncbi:hydroxymethylglutaryl-CoA reductase, degradative [Myxococcota bacterium]|nr:hydroxymethylglutaryl-CoA reductase, degradative [Myxococcota bacterium]
MPKNPPHTPSTLPAFYKHSLEQRRAQLAEHLGLDALTQESLWGEHPLPIEKAEQMVENVIGLMNQPLGVCLNLQLNGRDHLVPMAIEEASVVAAASHAAKLLRAGGGLHAESTPPLMIGQVQLCDIPDMDRAIALLREHQDELLAQAASLDPRLVEVGGGPRAIELRRLDPLEQDDPLGPMLIVHLIVDVRDAMGANAVNTMCEGIAPRMAQISGGRARLRILSNLADKRLVTVRGNVPFAAFCKPNQPPEEGQAIAYGVQEASIFAERDPYRAATHNKGIMNGIDAVLVATGQDYRAVEAGAHAYASQQGRYTALSRWRVREGALHGEITLPMAVGVVGGVIRVHPTAKAALQIMQISTAQELAQIAAAIGLAQNLAALRALANEGIQQGHMRLHSRNIAAEIGAIGNEIDLVAQRMAQRGGRFSHDIARSILQEIRKAPEYEIRP